MKSVVRSLRLLSSRDRTIFVVLAIARAMAGFLDLLGIFLIGVVGVLAVNTGSSPSEFQSLGFKIAVELKSSSLLILMVVIFAVFVVKAAVTISLSRVQTTFLSSVDSKMARQAAAYYFAGPYTRLRSQQMSALHWTLSESVIQAFFVTLGSFSSMIADATTLILVCSLMFVVDPLACLFAVLYFLVIAVAVQRVVGVSQAKLGSRMAQVAQQNLNAVEDAFVAFRDNHVYGQKVSALNQIDQPRSTMSRGIGTLQFLNVLPRTVSEVALMLGVLSFITWQFLAGSLEQSVGVVAVFMAAGVRILSAIAPLQGAIASLRNASSQSDLAVQAIEAYQSAHSGSDLNIYEPSAPQIPNDSPIGVNVKNVDFSFPDSTKKALKNINVEIKPGSFVAFIGPSGAGKTTLVDLILGLFQPDVGSVTLSGIPASKAIEEGLVSVAYVPQKPAIINGTILENIALSSGDSLPDRELAIRVLQATHLDEMISDLPNGLDTELAGSHARLSGGQVQRIGLARALYTNPRLLILDEATSALDAETESFIAEAVSLLTPSTTVIVIAHRLSTVQHADEVFLVENGNITDRGDFRTLRLRNPLIERYVKLMSFEEIPDSP